MGLKTPNQEHPITTLKRQIIGTDTSQATAGAKDLKQKKGRPLKMNHKSRLSRIITTVIALVICFAMTFTTVTAYAFTSTGEKYYSDVTTLEEAVANAAVVGE